MKQLTIGFSKPIKSKIGAWLIEKWMNKPYSHVFFYYQDDQKRDLVFQAAHGLVHLISLERFLHDNKIVKTYVLDATPGEYQAFRDYYYSKLGLPYDFMDLVFVFLFKLLGKLGIKHQFPNYSGYICSELASDCLAKVFKVPLNKPANMYDPSDVEDLLV
jgi:hypothetical protein